ncbi:2-oxo acid dehydrogenase subunit E2 [Pigmentiphaga aceris]|uniref:Dihydrolipoamide acetyltransferase component of pyruvate dehydrogenase complex n=1 Tax=Pigmentiphaga aceris TaxID=1940612 RepID=A0A5C0B1K3_9BURK|nr:dihydrolipoamide acetyltransferase family protein [Pigmentiphaga aceris]QEI08588.1 2-oxo acid dehydrogenase subunit E2 [Pigmentiphaga aceris]
MGIHVIKMPDIGEGIAEVELAAWHVKVGDVVSEDQILADVMTDKATVEIPSPVVGKVLALGGAVGEVMAVGGELIRIEVEGAGNLKEGASAAKPAAAANAAGTAVGPDMANVSGGAAPADIPKTMGVEPAQAETKKAPASPAAASAATAKPAPKSASGAVRNTSAARPDGERALASPAVRQRAWDLGIDIQFVHGTGPAGRVTYDDIDAFLAGKNAQPTGADTRYAVRADEEEVPVIGLRRKIAQKMQEAKRRIPHFTYVEEIDVTELESLRAQLNAKWGKERGKLTVLPLLVRAVVIALRDFPQINARYDDEAGVVTRYGAVHCGIATQTSTGLMVPVVRNAESRDPWGNAAEIARLADAARTGKAGRDELSGSTITITSLGALGGIVSTPVINHPEVGIVGVNRMVERPVVRDGAIVIRKMMNLSSSFDHRVVDGADAAEFIQSIRALLEHPALLFVE